MGTFEDSQVDGELASGSISVTGAREVQPSRFVLAVIVAATRVFGRFLFRLQHTKNVVDGRRLLSPNQKITLNINSIGNFIIIKEPSDTITEIINIFTFSWSN